MNLTLEEDSDYVKIRVDGLLHVHFLRKNYRGLSSYNNGIYCIEISLSDTNILLEYDKREYWVKMLLVLDEAL